jgi:hypothetical protein
VEGTFKTFLTPVRSVHSSRKAAKETLHRFAFSLRLRGPAGEKASRNDATTQRKQEFYSVASLRRRVRLIFGF